MADSTDSTDEIGAVCWRPADSTAPSKLPYSLARLKAHLSKDTYSLISFEIGINRSLYRAFSLLDSSFLLSLASAITSAPSAFSSKAIAAPKPLLAPVIKKRLLLKHSCLNIFSPLICLVLKRLYRLHFCNYAGHCRLLV